MSDHSSEDDVRGGSPRLLTPIARPRLHSGLLLGSAALLFGLFLSSAVALGAAGARTGAPGSWSLAGSGIRSISGQIGTARTSDGVLHVIWSRGGPGTPWALLETAISPSGKVAAPRVIVSGWSRIDDAAAVAKGSALTVVFPGVKTDATGDPTDGLNIATRNGAGWSVPAAAIYGTDFGGSSVPTLALTGDGTPVQAWSANGKVVVHSGIDPTQKARSYGIGGNVTLLGYRNVDSAAVGWCASGARAGIYLRSFYTSPSAPSNLPTLRMPGSSTTRCSAASRAQFVARTGGGTFVAASVSSEHNVLVWETSGKAGMNVAGGSGIKQQIALAADPNGRLWVGWRDADSGHLFFRRSNRTATEWGAVVSAAPPAGQAGGIYNLDLSAQDDRVDVIARTDNGSSAVSLFHTQMLPGLSVNAADDRGRVTVTVTDAGDPVPGSSVRLGGHVLRTAADGTATIDLASGSYPVEAAKAGYVDATASVHVKAGP